MNCDKINVTQRFIKSTNLKGDCIRQAWNLECIILSHLKLQSNRLHVEGTLKFLKFEYFYIFL